MILNLSEHETARARFPKCCLFIWLLITFFAAVPAVAQGRNDSTASANRALLACGNAIRQANDVREWSLRIGSALGYGVVRDAGTAPITFHGPLLMPSAGLQYRRNQWKYSNETSTTIGYYENRLKPRFNFSTFDINNTLRLKAMRHIHNELAELWLGVSATNFLDVTVNMQYENAAAGVSEFVGPELWVGARKQFGTSRFSFVGELGVMPVAGVLRPGYAYIDNYTATQPVLNAVFDDYEWHAKAFAALATTLGVDLNLLNGNHIILSYDWNFHSSGKSGHWRFDHAMHALNIDLVFNLKKRYTYE